jgi:hypothetical protein
MVMTPEEFAAKMQEIHDKSGTDAEAAHGDMDDLMGSLLIDLGYEAGVRIFDSQVKWYA